jgi:hypothetical protein
MRRGLVLAVVGSALAALSSVDVAASPVLMASAEAPDPALACIQRALGGADAFARVSSLHIVSHKKPGATTGMRTLEGSREIWIVLPDRYKRHDVGTIPGGAGATLASTLGFDRDTILNRPGQRDAETSRRAAREAFVREMLMRLPRALTGATFSSHPIQDAGQARLALEATGPDGSRATLVADSQTCVPTAVLYKIGASTARIDLSTYRTFDGIRFPTVLTMSRSGVPVEMENVSTIEVNAPATEKAFTPTP